MVRVRDPFGSLTRERLKAVLQRCASPDGTVQVDETMGGAGLGMWRLFTIASFIGISVVKDRQTEVLVGFAKRSARQKPFAYHMFFRTSRKRTFWKLFKDDSATTNRPEIDKSVVLVSKSST